MKRTASVILIIVMLFALFYFSSSVYGVSQDTDIALTRLGTSDTYYSFDASTKTLTISGEGDMPNFTNSSSASNGQPWFSWRSDGSIEKVVVEEGVTSLGSYAFYFVTASDISLPSTLETIGSYSMACNNKLTQYVIPNGVNKLGTNAFYYCSSLEKVIIPDTVTSIGASCFQQCAVLSSVEFSNLNMKVTIGRKAFVGCASLSVLTVPKQATLSAYAYGYRRDSAGAIYDNVLMRVYRDSSAYDYAQSNLIDYELISDMELFQGMSVSSTYYQSNVNESMVYTFTPTATAVYDFYSSGDIDVDCTVKSSDGTVVAFADDNSNMDLNFTISTELNLGETYTFTVNSVHSTGDYTVTLYPHNVSSIQPLFSVAVDATANKPAYYDIIPLIENNYINIVFDTGYSEKVSFVQNGKISLLNMLYSDNQVASPFSCGENFGTITVGNASTPLEITVNHSYEKIVLEPDFESPGYTMYKCVSCSDTYFTDYQKRLGLRLEGRAVLMQSTSNKDSNSLPISYARLYVDGEVVGICDENGYFEVYVDADTKSFTIGTDYSVDRTVAVPENEFNEVIFADLAVMNYDIYRDGYVNAKDYATFKSYFGNYDSTDKKLCQLDVNKDGVINDEDFLGAVPFYSYGKITETLYN